MRKFPALLALTGLSYILIAAVPDWLNYGGDPQRSSWQKRDRYIDKASLKQFKLLWKRTLDNESKGLNSLTAPVIFGPIITHRGMKELVLIAGASDNVYAVDADLGRIFWKRHIETAEGPDRNAEWPCGAGLTAAPVIAPLPPARPGAKPNEESEDPTPPRPLYVVASDGKLHTIRTTLGTDIGAPVQFLPPNATSASLNMAGGKIYSTTSGNCGGAPRGVWSLDVTAPDAKANFVSAPATAGVSVGFDGTIYSGVGADQLAGAPTVFKSQGRELLAAVTQNGRVILLDARSHRESLFATEPKYTGGSLATWEDAAGTRWIYVASQRNITAFKMNGNESHPELAPVWVSRDLVAPLAPAIVNGMVFALSSGEFTGSAKTIQERISRSTHATLYALDALTGKELYSSGDTVTSFTHSSGLAVANGHVCFGAFDNTLYCFGIPTDI